MDRKYFQIKMKPEVHKQLKFRAKQLGISIGEYLENLVSSMELRLSKTYKTVNIQSGLVDELFLKILLKDTLSIDEEELRKEMDKASKTTSTTSNGVVFKATITV